MVQEGDGLGLVMEAAPFGIVGEDAGFDHLQGHRPVEADLPGLVDDPHAAAAQLAAESRSRRNSGPLYRAEDRRLHSGPRLLWRLALRLALRLARPPLRRAFQAMPCLFGASLTRRGQRVQHARRCRSAKYSLRSLARSGCWPISSSGLGARLLGLGGKELAQRPHRAAVRAGLHRLPWEPHGSSGSRCRRAFSPRRSRPATAAWLRPICLQISGTVSPCK